MSVSETENFERQTWFKTHLRLGVGVSRLTPMVIQDAPVRVEEEGLQIGREKAGLRHLHRIEQELDGASDCRL